MIDLPLLILFTVGSNVLVAFATLIVILVRVREGSLSLSTAMPPLVLTAGYVIWGAIVFLYRYYFSDTPGTQPVFVVATHIWQTAVLWSFGIWSITKKRRKG